MNTITRIHIKRLAVASVAGLVLLAGCGGATTADDEAAERIAELESELAKAEVKAETEAETEAETGQVRDSGDPPVDPPSDREPSTQVEVEVVSPDQSFDADAYRNVDDRELSQIARQIDQHVGEQIVVFGDIWQFDNATGPDAFLANIGGEQWEPDYPGDDFVWYEVTDAMLVGDTDQLIDFVEGDHFRAHVTVLDVWDYESVMTAELSVPLLQVDRINMVE